MNPERRRRVKHAAAFFVWFVVLWWLWQLLAGEWNATEWIAGAGAAVIAGAIAEAARHRAGAAPGAPVQLIRSAPSALGMVFVDFALVMWALFLRRGGSFRTTDTDAAGDEQQRAWATYLATISPNAYVIDIDAETGSVLTHHLVPLQASQDPA